MKKQYTFLLIILGLLACSQVYGQKKKKKVAVVTFYIDKYIDFTNLQGPAGLAASIASLSNDPNFDLKPVLNNFHDVFFKDFSKVFPFELADEKEVLSNENYQAYESGEFETSDRGQSFLSSLLPYEGYKPMYLSSTVKKENKNHMKMIEIFKEKYDGVMFVSMSYDFVEKLAIGGIGSAGIRSYVHIKMWDMEGNRIFNMHEYGTSKKSVTMVAGIPVTKPSKLQPICQSASDRLLRDLYKKMPKILRKIDKRFDY